MTLKELAQAILALPEAEQNQPALHVEPYDEGAEVTTISLHQATEPITDAEGTQAISEGRWYLQ